MVPGGWTLFLSHLWAAFSIELCNFVAAAVVVNKYSCSCEKKSCSGRIHGPPHTRKQFCHQVLSPALELIFFFKEAAFVLALQIFN